MREYEQLRRQRPGYIAWKAAYNERQRLAYAQRRGTNLAERIPYSKSASVAP